MTQKTWLVVANASTARIFNAEGKENLTKLEEFYHEESRQNGINLNSDRPGRVGEKGAVTRHALEESTPPKQIEAQKFAKEIAKYLDTEREKGGYERLYIASSPSFLGLLRSALSEQVSSKVIESFSKDLTAVEPNQIRKHVYLTFGIN